MEIIYGKNLTKEEFSVCQQIAFECGIMTDTARLLFCRGIDTVKKAKSFLNPGKHGFHNPYLLNGMSEAVALITQAKNTGKNVLVFGDYDADGICATTVLYYCLKDFGIDARTVIPEREEGYGLNVEKIKTLNSEEKIDLLITVDCGISDGEKIEEIKKLGVEVIVTDHHEPPQILPDSVKINPKIAGQDYPFSGLCGAGVAFKLGYALVGEKANEYLDYVALATVADSMELIGENRDIVVEGLKLFSPTRIREQFKCILGDNSRSVTAQTMAYTIAPKINAGGRMGNANVALKLFLTQDKNKIFDYTAKLTEYNVARQIECDNIYREAKEKIYKEGLEDDYIILVGDKNWKAGFVGIVAAKLVEDYCRPVIVFAGHDGYLKGSARSVDDINIYDAIDSVQSLLLGYGGHSQAAGVSVSEENFERLRTVLNEYVKQNFGQRDRSKKIQAEWEINGEFSMRFAREIERLEPCGVGNRRPLFTTTVGAVESMPLKQGSPHFSFRTETLEMLQFNGEADVLTLSLPIEKKIVFEVNLSTYKNKQSLKGYVKTVLADYKDFKALKLHVFANTLEMLTGDGVASKRLDRGLLGQFNRSGTMFAVTDTETIKKYPELSRLPVYLFVPEQRNLCACIVVSPKDTFGFERVIYLDRPVQAVAGNCQCYTVDGIIGYGFIEALSTERSAFADIYTVLRQLSGKAFKNIVDFTYKNAGEENKEQFLFVTKVFLELGIFYVKNGIFLFDCNVKNPLTNSKVYSKISVIKN